MKYITLNDLASTIRKNLHKIPHDVDFVIGIPRSGTIVASIISEYLNVPLVDLDSFCKGGLPVGGGRLSLVGRREASKKVLVVDDTVFRGTSMRKTKEKLKDFSEYKFVYLVAYLEGSAIGEVNIYLEDVRKYTKGVGIVLYEWNIFNHYSLVSSRCMYDIDGVFCVDPPDERTGKEYEDYIENAVPFIIPRVSIGPIVTYRLEKYRATTEGWLKRQGIRYSSLEMFPAMSWEERFRSGISPEQMKANKYKSSNSILFIESEDKQAKEIYRLSGKPVLSIETNTLYGNG